MKTTIAKSDWLAAQECPAMAWHGLRTEGGDPPDEGTRFRMEQGQDVGQLAQQLYPEGVRASKALGKGTEELVADEAVETIFEASFRAGPLVARPDIACREDGNWHILEVKSSFASEQKVDELLDDLAYTVMVVKRAGLPIKKASLVLLSRGYRKGRGLEHLFEIIDVTQDVEARAEEFEDVADQVARDLLAAASPLPVLVSACRRCEFFADRCLGAGVEHSVLELPKLHRKKLETLSEAGIVDLSSVPQELELNERQQRVQDAVLTGEVFVDPGLKGVLAAIEWPCYYLDFESVATFLPLYEGHGCHEQVLTQFSIHHCVGISGEVKHIEYLADASRDCQRELAEALIDALGDDGSIMVYSHFESTRITALRDAFPALADPLAVILERLVDLYPIVKDYIYHPGFRGSFSIKKVLPELVPELSYEGLGVGDGSTAIARFARMARGEISGDELASTRQQLLDYCRMDTYAMVRLHQALHESVPKSRAAGSSI